MQHRFRGIAQLVEQRSPKPRAEGSSPSAPATSEWTSLHSDFSLQKNRSYASSFLLYRKRSHSRRLFGCKRPHNTFGSLPTFCECACGTNISMVRLFQVGASFISLAPIFLQKNQNSLMPLLLLFRKKARSARLFVSTRTHGRLTFATAFLRVYLRRKHHLGSSFFVK